MASSCQYITLSTSQGNLDESRQENHTQQRPMTTMFIALQQPGQGSAQAICLQKHTWYLATLHAMRDDIMSPGMYLASLAVAGEATKAAVSKQGMNPDGVLPTRPR